MTDTWTVFSLIVTLCVKVASCIFIDSKTIIFSVNISFS